MDGCVWNRWIEGALVTEGMAVGCVMDTWMDTMWMDKQKQNRWRDWEINKCMDGWAQDGNNVPTNTCRKDQPVILVRDLYQEVN